MKELTLPLGSQPWGYDPRWGFLRCRKGLRIFFFNQLLFKVYFYAYKLYANFNNNSNCQIILCTISLAFIQFSTLCKPTLQQTAAAPVHNVQVHGQPWPKG